jgi:lipid A 3-O-deacylase
MRPAAKYFLILSLLFICRNGYAQAGQVPDSIDDYMVRIYHDNDFISYRGKATDEAYTGGIRADFFFTKKKPYRFFIDRLFPKAGDQAVNIFQWGFMQVVYTPRDIEDSAYQPNDYAFSAGLYIIHSLYSYDPVKKFSFQTEIKLGVMGPAALGEQSQELIHRVMGYETPNGWKNQLNTDVLFNVNFTAEKQFLSLGQFAELTGGSKISAGTLVNAVSVYPLIRIGWMNPYFDGYISQYAGPGHAGSSRIRKFQFYLFAKPSINWVLTNAMLEGGFFSDHSRKVDGKLIQYQTYHSIEHLVYQADFGAVLNNEHFSISFDQNISSMLIKNTYSHEYGNVSIYFTW